MAASVRVLVGAAHISSGQDDKERRPVFSHAQRWDAAWASPWLALVEAVHCINLLEGRRPNLLARPRQVEWRRDTIVRSDSAL